MTPARGLPSHVCGCGKGFNSAEGLIAHQNAKHAGRPCDGPKCGYCGSPAVFVRSSEMLYGAGRDYGPAWVCRPCEAWVGCHPGTAYPLGRLADKALRQAKMNVHREFDPIWRRGYAGRREAYAALAAELGISPAECHVGMFDLALCERAVAACQVIGPRFLSAWKAAKRDRIK